jgi:acyl dehydratase
MAGIKTDCVGKEIRPADFEWTWKDIALYNLAIGATDLDHVYENVKGGLRVIPTWAVIAPFPALLEVPGLTGVNPMTVLHGEQKIILKKRPLPVRAKVVTTGKITELLDKGKGALLRLHTETKTKDGEPLFDNVFSAFARGAGGFGGERGPEPGNVPPERAPDAVVEYQTLPIQHLIYRLTGDINPLHVDPNFAKIAGYPKPILHGLCTFGHVGRAVIEACCAGNDARLLEFEVRFRDVAYPGQKIITKIWKQGNGKAIVAAATDDGKSCITNAAALFDE